MKKYVVGNWKMNGNWEQNSQLLSNLKKNVHSNNEDCYTIVCVPYPYLVQAKGLLHNTCIAYGAQDVSCNENGAYTGEVSAEMLKDMGCRYVIVGHSERRIYHAETNDLIARKTNACLKHRLTPIICVGETLQERQQGQTFNIVQNQLNGVLEKINKENFNNIIIAYEPVWAIGTGQTANPEQAQEVHKYLRQVLSTYTEQEVSILYGGSVKSSNAQIIFSMPDINGGLIGGASLISDDFISINDSINNI